MAGFNFPKKTTPPIISGENIRIGSILFDTLDLNLSYDSTARTFSLKNGIFRLDDLRIQKKDTLSPSMVSELDISGVEHFSMVSPTACIRLRQLVSAILQI
ncbi:MAG: hypothetical protein IPH20_26045 [Bacteroidales bacterium]|nr:hypothetical protein [Bacteroidales bacterium]